MVVAVVDAAAAVVIASRISTGPVVGLTKLLLKVSFDVANSSSFIHAVPSVLVSCLALLLLLPSLAQDLSFLRGFPVPCPVPFPGVVLYL